MTSRFHLYSAVALAAVISLIAPGLARADLDVYFQEDAKPKVLVASDPVDFDPLGVGYNAVFGDFLVNFFGATSTNSASGSDLMSSTTKVKNDDTGKSHTLTIYISQDDYTLPGTSSSTIDMSSHIGGSWAATGAGQALTFQSYANNSNGLFDTVGATTTGPQKMDLSTPATGSFDSSPDPSTLFVRTSSMYSVTTTNAITVAPSGQLNFSSTTALTAVPVPAGLVLAMSALPALGFGGWLSRRRRLAA